MEWIIIAGLIIALLLIGVITLKRRLTTLNSNVGNAMVQVGVQLSSRFDALAALMRLTEQYVGKDMRILPESAETCQGLTAESTPEDIMRQEDVIADALTAICAAARQCPALQENEEFTRWLEAVDTYEKMLNTSRLIYNDSAKKLNHSLSVFPVNLIGPLLGITRREYLHTHV